MVYRIVVDTNIFISATFWGGPPRDVIELVRDNKVTLLTLTEITAKLNRVLNYPKFAKLFKAVRRTPQDILNEYLQLTEEVTPDFVPLGVIRDTKDNMILAAAVGGSASCLVTGDKDLLDLRQYKQVTILTASQFIELLTNNPD